MRARRVEPRRSGALGPLERHAITVDRSGFGVIACLRVDAPDQGIRCSVKTGGRDEDRARARHARAVETARRPHARDASCLLRERTHGHLGDALAAPRALAGDRRASALFRHVDRHGRIPQRPHADAIPILTPAGTTQADVLSPLAPPVVIPVVTIP